MSHDPHLGFIVAAYALAVLIVAGMIVTILVDYLNLKQMLASFAVRDHRDNSNIQVPDTQELNHRVVAPRSSDPEGLP